MELPREVAVRAVRGEAGENAAAVLSRRGARIFMVGCFSSLLCFVWARQYRRCSRRWSMTR